MTGRIALATCTDFPAGEDGEGPLLVAALQAQAVTVDYVPWDEPGHDWAGYDRVVVRETWDYPPRQPDFLRWARSVPRLANPAPLIEWNADKTYLGELAAAGVPTIPTQFVRAGDAVTWPDGEFVVKPSVGAGSLGAGRFQAGATGAAAEHVAGLHEAGRVAMVQPYLDLVDEAGETSLLYFAGTFSHAIRKGPMLPPDHVHSMAGRDELFVAEEITTRIPSGAEHAVGAQVLAMLPVRDPLYARVDLLPTADGPVLGEVELIEPSLFLRTADGAADRFAAAILAGR